MSMNNITERARLLSHQRKKRIFHYIQAHRSAQITQLSDMFEVSLSTVRRDLAEMEEDGLVQRVRGGAILSDDAKAEESPLQLRASIQAEAKERIARAAADLVQDAETIIISTGTTTLGMTKYLTERRDLTVITNAVNVAYHLANHPHIQVVMLGGWLRHSEYSVHGHLTMQAMRDLRAAKIFHGTFGISVGAGLTGTHLGEVETDRSLMAAADELIILADGSKFHQAGPIILAPVDNISTIVTDANAYVLEPFTKRGISIIHV